MELRVFTGKGIVHVGTRDGNIRGRKNFDRFSMVTRIKIEQKE